MHTVENVGISHIPGEPDSHQTWTETFDVTVDQGEVTHYSATYEATTTSGYLLNGTGPLCTITETISGESHGNTAQSAQSFEFPATAEQTGPRFYALNSTVNLDLTGETTDTCTGTTDSSRPLIVGFSTQQPALPATAWQSPLPTRQAHLDCAALSAGDDHGCSQVDDHWLRGAYHAERDHNSIDQGGTLVGTEHDEWTTTYTLHEGPPGAPPAVVDYAPQVRFHPDEGSFPMGTDEFVAGSALQWAEPVGPVGGVRETLADVGGIDPVRLALGGYTAHAMSTADLSRPGDPGRGADPPTSGFVLNLDDDLRPGDVPDGSLVDTPLTYSYEAGDHVTYWFMYGWNPGAPGTGEYVDHHEGEWERVTVLLDNSDHATAVDYWAHECTHPIRVPWSELTDNDPDYGEIVFDTHPVVYSALGSHASFPDQRTVPAEGVCDLEGAARVANGAGVGQGWGDVTADPGAEWNTWDVELRDAETSPWYGYGGGWGDYGSYFDCPPTVAFFINCVNVVGPLAPPLKQPEEGLDAPTIYGPAPKTGLRVDWDQANEAAIDRFIWAPGIDRGFTPQGIEYIPASSAFTGPRLLVSGYMPDGRGCRIYAVDPITGHTTGPDYRLPDCTHAGGIEYAGRNRLYVADSHRIWRLNLKRVFSTNTSSWRDAVTGSWAVERANASFITFEPDCGQAGCLWAGHTGPLDGNSSKLYRLPSRLLDTTDRTTTPINGRALSSQPLDSPAQGGDYAPDGDLWTTSGVASEPGCITHDRNPAFDEYYQTFPGIEELAFDPNGGLWAVSEAGSVNYDDNPDHLDYPLIVHINPDNLTGAGDLTCLNPEQLDPQ